MKILPVNIVQNKKFTPVQKKLNFEQKVQSNSFSNIYFGRDLVSNYNRETVINFLNSNPKPVASGTDGVIYRLGNKAIKVAKEKELSFESEANILKKLPKNLKCSQSYIDYFRHNDKDVLVSSFVEGTHKQAISGDDLDKLFDIILEHDKANIIHGDLNLGNIVFSSSGELSFIDYGVAFQPSTTEVELYPSFVTNTNALKFENTGLCDSFKHWKQLGTEKQNFEEYLSKKAEFYSKHSSLAKTPEAKRYEENLAKVLTSPSSEIIKAELLRIETLDLLEMADTATNYNNAPNKAIELWNKTVSNARDFEKFTTERIESAKNLSEKEYFVYQNQIAKCFYATLLDWETGTVDWLTKINQDGYIPQSENEQRIKNNWGLGL